MNPQDVSAEKRKQQEVTRKLIEYIARAGRKGDALEDLKKARFYLQRRIDTLEE